MQTHASDPDRPWGLWLVGARGSVATTTAAGWAALVDGTAPATGLVTALPAFADAPLPPLADLVIGGCDVVDDPLPKRAAALEEARVLPHGTADRVADRLADVDARLTAGITAEEAAAAPSAAVDRIAGDLRAFAEAASLARVVVVHLTPTEAPVAPDPVHGSADALLAAVADDRPGMPPSALYALAAARAGAAFVDFTPAPALGMPGVVEAAVRAGTPVAGRDGKTGETLLKTVLAPMFADRHLDVRSWSGTNLLGGGDGRALADPARAASKVASKASSLEAVLGHTPEGAVRIDHVPSLGDWKTAWDLITFEGFLGTPMRLQFTWEGCDSALAAPLVLDLARLAAAAAGAGCAGPLPALGYFFKDPLGSREHRLSRQFDELVAWAAGLGADPDADPDAGAP